MRDTFNWILIKGSVAVSAALLLNACAPVEGASTTEAKQEILDRKTAAGDTDFEVPEGAEPFEDGAYAVPHSVDGKGCEMFTIARPGGHSQRVFYFRSEGTSFSPRKSQALCNVVMEEDGSDAEGCPTFRAVQPDGSSSDATYYRAQGDSYTAYKERSTCDS